MGEARTDITRFTFHLTYSNSYNLFQIWAMEKTNKHGLTSCYNNRHKENVDWRVIYYAYIILDMVVYCISKEYYLRYI